jgi:hypothetical protein
MTCNFKPPPPTLFEWMQDNFLKFYNYFCAWRVGVIQTPILSSKFYLDSSKIHGFHDALKKSKVKQQNFHSSIMMTANFKNLIICFLLSWDGDCFWRSFYCYRSYLLYKLKEQLVCEVSKKKNDNELSTDNLVSDDIIS